MNKHLINLALALSLSACGGGGDEPTTPDSEDPTITSPSISTDVTNNPAIFSGALTTSMTVESAIIAKSIGITDADTDEAFFTALTDKKTSFGTFSITVNGDWTYEIDDENTDITSLAEGASLTDTIIITSLDGTETTVVITIEKPNQDTPMVNSPAVITGTHSASIYHNGTNVIGSLSIADIESEAAFIPNSETTSYGAFAISSDGVWTYDLNKKHDSVLLLPSGETLTDTVTVTSVDNTTATVSITIEYGNGETLITPSLPSGVLTVPPIDCGGKEYTADEIDEIVSTDMAAGTTLCIADGTYTDKFEIKFGGAGTAEAPIKIAAKNPGKVIFTGAKVSIEMGGSYTQLQGLVFEDSTYSGSFIETRFGTADLCHNCRITENVIVNPRANSSGAIFAHIYGKNVWVDHNVFSGKTAENPMVSINRWIDDDWTEEQILAEIAEGIVVYGNYIANRPPANGKMYANSGDNDFEAVRTGLSDTHHYPSNSIVAGNLFENIQGEAEVISNKGSNNIISGNTVRNSYGSITNRHGNTNVISNNFMLGDGYPFAGGLRIADDGHSITNNYIEGARYKDTSHHGGIVILGSDGAGDGSSGYQQVENVHIAHNTIVNSVNSINIDGGGKKTQPMKVYFANNIVDQAIGDVFVDTARGISNDSVYTGNIVYGHADLAETDDVNATDLGATFVSAMLEKASDGLYRPSNNSPSLAASTYVKGAFADVTKDMDGTLRGDTTEAGADDINSDTIAYSPLSYGSVGPQSFFYPKPAAIMVEAEIANADFEQGAANWTGGTLINVNDGAFFGKGLYLFDSDTAVQPNIELTPNTRYAISAFVKDTYSFVINDHVFEDRITSSDYKYVVHEFTTGASETSGTITLKVADELVLNAGIVDGDMDDFQGNKGSLGVWVEHENSSGGIGDVGTSSDRAFDGGSARMKFKEDEGQIHDFTATPGVSQHITNVPTGFDLTYSLYFCDKKQEEDVRSLTTLYYGVKDASGTVIADARAHYSELADAPSGTTKDCFKQVTLDIPNNTNSAVEIFAVMEVDSTKSDEEIYADEQYTKDDLNIYIGEFSLTYVDAVKPGAEAMFDEVRLIKRTIDELAN